MTQVLKAAGMSWMFDMIKNNNIYYFFTKDDELYLCFWDPEIDFWQWYGTRSHTIVSREPLTLSPSIGWPTKHGWIREGQWFDAAG